MQGLIEGTNKEVTPWVCDVRDIARVHVLAAELPAAKGRYAQSTLNMYIECTCMPGLTVQL